MSNQKLVKSHSLTNSRYPIVMIYFWEQIMPFIYYIWMDEKECGNHIFKFDSSSLFFFLVNVWNLCKYRRVLNSFCIACMQIWSHLIFVFNFLKIVTYLHINIIWHQIEPNIRIPFSFSLVQCSIVLKWLKRETLSMRKWMMYAHHNCWHFFSVYFFWLRFVPKVRFYHNNIVSEYPVLVYLSVIEPFSTNFYEFFSDF